MRQRAHRDVGEPRDETGELVTPVETVGETGEVAHGGGVIRAIDRPVDVSEKRLHLT